MYEIMNRHKRSLITSNTHFFFLHRAYFSQADTPTAKHTHTHTLADGLITGLSPDCVECGSTPSVYFKRDFKERQFQILRCCCRCRILPSSVPPFWVDYGGIRRSDSADRSCSNYPELRVITQRQRGFYFEGEPPPLSLPHKVRFTGSAS